jgi:hypothetical protein
LAPGFRGQAPRVNYYDGIVHNFLSCLTD